MTSSEELYAKIKGIPAEDAKAAVDSIRKQIAERSPGKTPEEIEKILYMKISLAKRSGGEKAKAVIVSITSYRDVNFPSKKHALNKYAENPQLALTEGLVRLDENRQPIPIYSKEFFDAKKTQKNPNFRKDIEEELKREGILLIEDKSGDVFCVPFNGKLDANAGDNGIMTGKINKTDDGKLTKAFIYKEGWEPKGTSDPQELWNTTYDILSNSDMSVPIESVFDNDPGTLVAVIGKVTSIKVTKDGAGGVMVGITDIGLADDIVGFADVSNEVIKEQSENIPRGSEVIMFGTVNKYKGRDGNENQNINLLGVLLNPSSSELSGALTAIDDIEI
ncbi:MAG: hypothetical protein M0R80_09770 [Proteobacteria bacterium]|jgi:hypothetical protein|nr:hypothetical protein [Pseudomonadota bacterium]